MAANKADAIAGLKISLDSIIEESCDGESAAKRTYRSKRSEKRTDSDERYASESDAFNRIVSYLNVAERSEKQIREKLSRAGYETAAIEGAVERALQCSLIDDLRFADVLIRSRISQGRGISGIERELQQNGINPYDVGGWPDAYTDSLESEDERAFAFLEAHPTHAKSVRDSAYRKLVSKGFSSSAAAQAARKWAAQKNG